MRKLVTAIISTISIFATMPVVARAADFLNFGSTYNINGGFATTTSLACNNCGTFSNTITLNQSPQTFDDGAYQISEHTTFLSGGAEFVEFAIVRSDKGPLVANGSTNANTFQIWLNNIQLTSSALESTPYFDFATKGTANTGIKPGGILTVGPNPNPGSIGFGQNSFFQPGKVFLTGVPGTTAAYTFFTSSGPNLAGPFDTVAANRNFDPNATEFFFGFELTPAPGPVPGTGLLSFVAIGLLGLGSVGWKRLRHLAVNKKPADSPIARDFAAG